MRLDIFVRYRMTSSSVVFLDISPMDLRHECKQNRFKSHPTFLGFTSPGVPTDHNLAFRCFWLGLKQLHKLD